LLVLGGVAFGLYIELWEKRKAAPPAELTALEVFVRNHKSSSEALLRPINAPASVKKIAEFDLVPLKQQRSNLQRMQRTDANDAGILAAIALCDTIIALGEKRNEFITRLNRSREQTEANRLVTANREGETVAVVRSYDPDWRTRDAARAASAARIKSADVAAQQADIQRRIEHFD